MVHCRDAFPDLIDILTANRHSLNDTPGVIHFFTGTIENAQKLLGLNFAFTFGGVITFARSYDEILKMLPADHILSETDAPYVSPEPYRGKRNEPAYVIEVVRKLAEIKGLTPEEMAAVILANARKIFRLDQ